MYGSLIKIETYLKIEFFSKWTDLYSSSIIWTKMYNDRFVKFFKNFKITCITFYITLVIEPLYTYRMLHKAPFISKEKWIYMKCYM